MAGIKDASIPDPAAGVRAYFGILRKRHIIGRLISILSIALSAALIYDLITIVVFNLLGLRMNVPFLFEILAVTLLIREIPKWKTEYLASLYDNRFHLKDRLYSYVWYSRNMAVPDNIRRAQANESLLSIDFSHILHRTKVRFPYYLTILFLITGIMLYLSWNAEYRPSGLTTRIVTQILGPEHPPINPVSNSELATPGTGKRSEADPVAPPLQSDKDSSNLSSSTAAIPGSQGKDQDNDMSSVSGDTQLEEDLVPEETTTSGGSSGQGLAGRSGLPGSTEPPETITSIPESATVSEPIPPLLTNSSSYAFQELPDATRFLSLIPDQGDPSLGSLDRETISNFEAGIERFPDLYRDHLQTYYWELKKWSKNP